jgi:hypothetical protein
VLIAVLVSADFSYNPLEDTMLKNTIYARITSSLMVVPVIACLLFPSLPARAGQAPAPALTGPSAPPASVVKLIFIHHSTGENWLADGNGGLGIALGNNNYFVSDTNYNWGHNSVGSRTDITNWLEWFRSADTPTYMTDLYAESEQHSSYTRSQTVPGGANEIIMFKSCFPNSALDGAPNDTPSDVVGLTVGHAKYVYNQLLIYFQQHPEKLFVVLTAPPLSDPTYAANARAFNQWLVNDWLSQNSYTLKNVAVYDFYNVLTSNGGSSTVNDLNSDNGHHHRWWNGAVQHKTDGGANVLAYPSYDDHPSRAGNLKATAEFVPMLNVFYNKWKSYRLTVNVVSNNASKGGGRIYNNGTTLIDCSNTGSNPAQATGTCWADLASGANVTLIQSPGSDSTLATWSGACSGTGPCEVATIAADTTITATFPYSSMAKVTSSGHGHESLVSAYTDAAASDTILARAVTFIDGSAGSLVTLNSGKFINLLGGLDAYYSATDGYTTIRNALAIRNGRLNVLGGIKIQQNLIVN